MGQSVNQDWLIKILVFDIIFCIIIYIFNSSLMLSILVFIGFFIAAVYLLYSIKCPHCGNLGALHKTNTKKINSNQHRRYITRRENAGHSVYVNQYGESVGGVHHFIDRTYVEIVTVGTYEDTFVCQYCGFITTKQYHSEEGREVIPT